MGLPHLCLAKNNDREKRPQTRAPRPKGRFARRVPRKSNESRFPFGRGARRRGAAVVRRLRSGLSGTRIALQTPPPRQRPSCERSPPFIPTWALARPLACPFGARASPSATLAPLGSIGAAALVRALLVLKLPLRVPSGAAFICASRSSNDCPWDSQPRPAELVVPHLPLIVLSVPLGGAVAFQGVFVFP